MQALSLQTNRRKLFVCLINNWKVTPISNNQINAHSITKIPQPPVKARQGISSITEYQNAYFTRFRYQRWLSPPTQSH
ncbi:hypothetical protein ENC22_19695 [Hahella sp. KA22]|nr:hypothetical protein ENC22_19695 [Hahella sp. KA22]